MRKAEMGIGTLILFITFIIVAAVAVIVLMSTTGILQSKALNTGKGVADEVSSQLRSLEIYAVDGTTNNGVDYFYNSVKLAGGSETFKFTSDYILFTVSLSNVSQDYVFDGNDATGVSYINCSLDPTVDTSNYSIANSTNDGFFGIEYTLTGPKFAQGYLSEGDVIKICYKAPRSVAITEDVQFTFLPVTGSPMRLKLTMPSIISEKRLYIFP